jgi:hypothetical protein
MKRIISAAEKGVVDVSGTKFVKDEKATWLKPLGAAFLFALLLVPILSVIYTLSYEGIAPKAPSLELPSIAYDKTPNPPQMRLPSKSAPVQKCVGSACVQGANYGQVTAITSINLPTQNLKQRTTDLCQAIITEMPQREEYEIKQWPDSNPPSMQIAKQRATLVSNFFRWKFLKKIRALRDEYAQLHIKDGNLDEVFEEDDSRQQMSQMAPGVPPLLFGQYEWDKMVNALTAMEEQLKD